MDTTPHPRIIGASVLGFALVAGAYVLANFGEPRTAPPVPATSQSASVRVPLVVTDNDNNGIEDWRDNFITTEPIIIEQTESDYTPPDTLTGQLGVNFFQNVVYARGYEGLGQSDEEIIENTVDVLTQETAVNLYDTTDITILTEWSEQDIINYANGAALAILNNNLDELELENELFILEDIIKNGEKERVTELETLATVYKNTRDDTLSLNVPGFLAKEHLDLINSYNAVYSDVDAMTESIDDPAFAFLRLKRYEDDTLGISYSLQNMYKAVAPYAGLFASDDPALLFVLYSPSNFPIN